MRCLTGLERSTFEEMKRELEAVDALKHKQWCNERGMPPFYECLSDRVREEDCDIVGFFAGCVRRYLSMGVTFFSRCDAVQ
jgi:hypothetical protein